MFDPQNINTDLRSPRDLPEQDNLIRTRLECVQHKVSYAEYVASKILKCSESVRRRRCYRRNPSHLKSVELKARRGADLPKEKDATHKF